MKQDSHRSTDTPAWENIVLLLAAFAIWPRFILGWREPVWTWLAYGTLLLLGVVLVRRMKRFRAVLEQGKRDRPGSEEHP